MADMLGVDRRINKQNPLYLKLKKGDFPSVDKSIPNWWRYERFLSNRKYEDLPLVKGGSKADYTILNGSYKKLKNGGDSQYNLSHYKWLLNSPFLISAKCCSIMKKKPAHTYNKKSKRKPFTAQMASESRLRTYTWLANGCNAFNASNPISNPMSFWTEQDVLYYIKLFNLEICSVYGDVVEADSQLQLSVSDNLIDAELFERPALKTTGCNRTGCMFCGYGCHLEKAGEGRFELMKKTHPKQYEYIMKPEEKGGLGYKEKIDWLNENGNLNIRY